MVIVLGNLVLAPKAVDENHEHGQSESQTKKIQSESVSEAAGRTVRSPIVAAPQ